MRAVMYAREFIERSANPLVRKNRTYRGRKKLSVELHGRDLRDRESFTAGSFMDWGRSFDMKGGVVANAAVICALAQADIKTGGDVVFESVVDEEWGGGGGTIAPRPEGRRRRFCIISEGTIGYLSLHPGSRGYA